MCLSKLSWHGRNGNYGIYDLFLQLLPPHHVGCEFPSRNGAGWLLLRNRTGFTLILDQVIPLCVQVALCSCTGAHNWRHSSQACLFFFFFVWSPHIITSTYHVCVCLFSPCLPWQGGAEGGLGARRDKGGGWWHSVPPTPPSPRKLCELQKPELHPVKTMRGTRETRAHGG